MNSLREALERADDAELDEAAGDIARHAVQVALAHDEARTDLVRQLEQSTQLEAQRQRDLDAALADAIEVVARQRARLGRRVCNRLDGEIVRTVFESLRRVQADSADPGFPS